MEYLLRRESNGMCVEWAMEYMGYCIRDTSDWVSFSLGLLSVLTWTVAEIPQIITNYHQKSTHSLSIAFLATWVIGDIFNVLGCYMEPATLPTQYWTAVLYTIITMVLVMQTVYYDYLYPNMSPVQSQQPELNADQSEVDDEKARQINESVDPKNRDFYADISDKNEPPVNEPINVPETRDLYFMSARSLAKSSTPPLGSFLAQRMARQARTSLLEPFLAEEEIEAEPESTTRSKPLLSLVSTLTIVGLVNLYSSSRPSPAGFVIPVGRKLLQVSLGSPEVPKLYSATASFLGWGMAAIYMGGRIPQIFLNMKKGNVEGLNPLMFLFALIGNATYVASILVNSLEWSDLRPNLPWLVDAGGCVLLDGFILLQFLFLYYRKPKPEEQGGEQEHTYVV